MKKKILNLIWFLTALLFISPLIIVVVNSLKTFQEILMKPTELPKIVQESVK